MEIPKPERCIECRHEVNAGGLRFGLCPDCIADITIRQKHNIVEQELNAMSPTGKLAQRECPECHEMIDPRAWTRHWRKAHPGVQMPPTERKRKAWNRKSKPEQLPAQAPVLPLVPGPQLTPLGAAQIAIADECDAIKEMLIAKNAAYGNSALQPVRLFSKADTVEQIRVRIDDKLSRLQRGESAGEDVTFDLIGYLILLRVAEKAEKQQVQA